MLIVTLQLQWAAAKGHAAKEGLKPTHVSCTFIHTCINLLELREYQTVKVHVDEDLYFHKPDLVKAD